MAKMDTSYVDKDEVAPMHKLTGLTTRAVTTTEMGQYAMRLPLKSTEIASILECR
jgi:hypothetical protein